MRLDRSAALLTFGGRAAALIAIASTSAATTTTSAATAFVATFATALTGSVATIAAFAALHLITRITGLIIAGTAVAALVATAAAASTALTVALVVGAARRIVTRLGCGLCCFGWRSAKQALEPTEETAGGLWRFDRAGWLLRFAIAILAGALLEISVATRFAGLARLKRLGFARLERLLLARFARAGFATVRPERRTLIRLRTGVFVVGAVAPAHGWALGFRGREDFDFRFLAGGCWRLRGTGFRFVASGRHIRKHLRDAGGSRRIGQRCGSDGRRVFRRRDGGGSADRSGLRNRLVGGGSRRGRFARERVRVLALGRDDFDGRRLVTAGTDGGRTGRCSGWGGAFTAGEARASRVAERADRLRFASRSSSRRCCIRGGRGSRTGLSGRCLI